jgi:hypothetical protein
MSKNPDRVYIDKTDRQLYEKIEKEDDFFKEKTRKEQFLLTMALGFTNNIQKTLDTKDGFFLTKDLKYEDLVLIEAVALFGHNDIEILTNEEEVFQIAEKYAHAGIKILSDKIESTSLGNFWKHYEQYLHEIYDKQVCRD